MLLGSRLDAEWPVVRRVGTGTSHEGRPVLLVYHLVSLGIPRLRHTGVTCSGACLGGRASQA